MPKYNISINITRKTNKHWENKKKQLYTVFQKHVTTFLMISWTRTVCPLTKIFGTLITKTIGHRQVFLCSHLTCLVQLLYLVKLSRPTFQQKLNKIMTISQEDVILIKISIWQSSMVHGEHSVNCPTRVGNWEASTVCWRESARRGTNCPATRQR